MEPQASSQGHDQVVAVPNPTTQAIYDQIGRLAVEMGRITTAPGRLSEYISTIPAKTRSPRASDTTTLDGRSQAGGRGRTRPLDEFPKLKADLVRKLGACASCRRRRVSVRITSPYLRDVFCPLLTLPFPVHPLRLAPVRESISGLDTETSQRGGCPPTERSCNTRCCPNYSPAALDRPRIRPVRYQQPLGPPNRPSVSSGRIPRCARGPLPGSRPPPTRAAFVAFGVAPPYQLR
jgi:hypothetical protein